MIYTGFTDEASNLIEDQIMATEALSWDFLSLRTVEGGNIHDVSDEEFEGLKHMMEQSGLRVSEFGTLIGNWSKSIHDRWEITENEIRRCIPRMHALDVKYARVMSYAQEPWGENQHRKERYKRLKETVKLFNAEGLVAVHENCMNYGGFSAEHTLELLNEVPDLQLVFDTGNPIFQKDRSKPAPHPWQNAWEFYEKVKAAVVHVHIKDAKVKDGQVTYHYPGEGDAHLGLILKDLMESDYKGFLAIEPHMGKVFHDEFEDGNTVDQIKNYITYGEKLEQLVESVKLEK